MVIYSLVPTVFCFYLLLITGWMAFFYTVVFTTYVVHVPVVIYAILRYCFSYYSVLKRLLCRPSLWWSKVSVYGLELRGFFYGQIWTLSVCGLRTSLWLLVCVRDIKHFLMGVVFSTGVIRLIVLQQLRKNTIFPLSIVPLVRLRDVSVPIISATIWDLRVFVFQLGAFSISALLSIVSLLVSATDRKRFLQGVAFSAGLCRVIVLRQMYKVELLQRSILNVSCSFAISGRILNLYLWEILVVWTILLLGPYVLERKLLLIILCSYGVDTIYRRIQAHLQPELVVVDQSPLSTNLSKSPQENRLLRQQRRHPAVLLRRHKKGQLIRRNFSDIYWSEARKLRNDYEDALFRVEISRRALESIYKRRAQQGLPILGSTRCHVSSRSSWIVRFLICVICVPQVMAMTPGATIPGQGVGLIPSFPSVSGTSFGGRRHGKFDDSTLEPFRLDVEMREKNLLDASMSIVNHDLLQNNTFLPLDEDIDREADDKNESSQRNTPKRKRGARSDEAKAKRTDAERAKRTTDAAHAKRSEVEAKPSPQRTERLQTRTTKRATADAHAKRSEAEAKPSPQRTKRLQTRATDDAHAKRATDHSEYMTILNPQAVI